MSRLRLINISLLSLLSTLAFSQERDSVQADSVVRNRFIPTGIRVGTDLISIFKTQFQDDFSGWEVNGDVDFHRYYLAVDYGAGSRTFRRIRGIIISMTEPIGGWVLISICSSKTPIATCFFSARVMAKPIFRRT